MILRQNIHALKRCSCCERQRAFFIRLLCTNGEEKERQPPFLLVVGFEKFLCVFCLSCVVYIYKTLEEIGNREITQNGEKKSFEVGGLNDSTHYRLLSVLLSREKGHT